MPSPPRPSSFVERQPERAALARAVRRAIDGQGAFVRLRGAPGIGKTRLLEVVADDARSRSAGTAPVVCRAAGGEYERDLAFGVVRELLGPLLAVVDADLDPAVRGLVAPVFAGTASPAAPAPDVGAVLNALLTFVRVAAARAPLVLLVDDVQWADEDAVRFLAFLARRVETLPVVLVAGIREPDAASEERWRPLRAPATVATDLRLAPLTAAGTAMLAAEAFGVSPEERFVAACHEVAGGNPLLLRGLLRSLVDDGVAPVAAAAGVVRERPVPDLADWVVQRVTVLGSDAVAVARAVALLGDDAPLDRTARLAGLERSAAARSGDVLRGAALLLPERMAFVHPLVRAAVHEAMPSGARSEGHREAARLVAADHDGLARAAGHLQLTAPGGDPWAIELLTRAGDRALAEGAVDAAVRAWRRALDEPATGVERVTLLLALGRAIAATGDPEGVQLLLAAHAEAADVPTRALITRQLALITLLHGDSAGSRDRMNEAIAELGDAHPELLEALEADRCMYAHTTIEMRAMVLPDLREAHRRAVAGEVRNPAMLAAVALESALHGPVADGARFGRASLMGSEGLPDHGASRSQASIALVFCERYDEARAGFDRTIEVGTRTGALLDVSDALAGRSILQLALGDLPAAERDARAGLEALPTETPSVTDGLKRSALANVLVETGRPGEALAASGVVEAVAGTLIGEMMLTRILAVTHASVLRATGEHVRGLEQLQELDEWERRWGVVSPNWSGLGSALALALHEAERHDEARAAALDRLERARRLGLRDATGAALRTAAIVVGGPQGIELLGEAVTLLAAGPARLELARTQIELGAALRRAGQRRAAREPLTAARDLAERCGATVLGQRAHAELLASGLVPGGRRRAAPTR